MTIRVLLADDTALFRQGMAELLGRCGDVEVVGQAHDAHDVVKKATLLRPDVVLMDLAMPGGGGVEATRRLLAERPDQVVCMLTGSGQETDLVAAVRAGARGYLVKTVELETLCANLQVLADGGAVVTPHLAASLLEAFSALPAGGSDGPSAIATLSPREREVLEWVARGDGNAEIAERLVIAENTVKVHVRNILDKLQVRSRAHAAAYAVQEGLVTDIGRAPP
jgi:two-component system, NarL family, nitrate/nitrite response regulator NarL